MFAPRRAMRLFALFSVTAALAPATAAQTPRTDGHDAVPVPVTRHAAADAPLTETLTSDLGHGVHVSTAAEVTSWAITLHTNAWRTRARGVAHGAVGAYLLDAAGTVIDASDIHRFHTGRWPTWGGTGRAYTWADPLPFATGAKTASVVICHGRTIAGAKRTCAWPWMPISPSRTVRIGGSRRGGRCR